MSKIFQVGTFISLLNKIYRGDLTLEEIKRHADLGIGTFDDLDGELILLNGKFYKIVDDGVVKEPDLLEKVPFFVGSFFKDEKVIEVDKKIDFDNLQEIIKNNLDSDNFIYTILVEGEFEELKLRAIRKQEKPYKPIYSNEEGIQSEFSFEKEKGFLVGTFFPKYLHGINVSGLHIHFINSEKMLGGHVMNLKANFSRIKICKHLDFKCHLIHSEEVLNTEFQTNFDKEIKKVERG